MKPTFIKGVHYGVLLRIVNFKLNSNIIRSIVTTGNNNKMVKLSYPTVRRDSFSETFHGINVPDPYRWLENNDEEEVKQFCQEQQNLTQSFIEQAPNRNDIKTKLTDMFNFPKYGCPFKRCDNYFISENDGLQNQSVLFKFKNLNDDEHELFIDPNTFSADGSSSINSRSFSKDGKLMAYAISIAGSDWLTIKVRNVDTKIDLPDQLERAKSTGMQWTHDNLGFFYSKFDKTGNSLKETDENTDHKLYYHRINTPQSEDVLIYDTPDHPEYFISSTMSDCGKLLFISLREECTDRLWYYAKLEENAPINGRFEFYPIIEKLEAQYDYVTNDDNLVYFITNKNAPNFRVCRTDLKSDYPGDESNWIDIIAEDKKAVLDEAVCVNGDKLALIYMRDVINTMEIRTLKDGKLFKKFDLPIGTISSFTGRRVDDEIFFYLTSFLSPGTIYHYDFNGADDLKIFMEIKVKNFDPSEFVTKQLFFETKDGNARVPMFVTHLKDVELDSSNPCLLYGYGGFQLSIQPSFSVSKLIFVKHFKGVFVVANIRGGGEYGTAWYDSGRQLNKQKSYDDFQQAGEYLIENGYTCKEKLIIEGGSNGGLLVAVCANQRPDLFGAVVCHVGVLDLMRFDKFTVGKKWTCDYGYADDEKHFRNRLKLSPLHNVPNENIPKKYPATILLTSDHDNRVVPLHSFKFAAELQHSVARKVNEPILLRVEMNAGHGAGKSTEKLLEAAIDIYCFLQIALNLKFYD